MFEILGMVVFGSSSRSSPPSERGGDLHTGGTSLTTGTFLVAMSCPLRDYGFDTASTLAEETKKSAHRGAEAVIASVIRRVRHRRVFLYAMLPAFRT